MSSGFCADVSVALPSAAESAEVAVLAGVLAATYIRELVDRKEHDPGDDLISRLATDYVATGQLNRETAGHHWCGHDAGRSRNHREHDRAGNRCTAAASRCVRAAGTNRRPVRHRKHGGRAHALPHHRASQVDRVAIEDLTIGGQPIHAGDFLVMNLPAGNWDPDFVDNPRRVRRRPKYPRTLGFRLRRTSVHRTKSRASRNADRVRHAGPAPALAEIGDIAGCTEVQRRIRHLRHEGASR